MSEGGRFFPPPKYCSYSIFSWRMSLSSWPRSSSTVLAMGCGSHHNNAKWFKIVASTRTPQRGAEQVMFARIPKISEAADIAPASRRRTKTSVTLQNYPDRLNRDKVSQQR